MSIMKFYYKKMEFEVPESVYEPREDSMLLAKTLERLKLKGAAALEIGCGSGFLSVLLAKKKADVTAVDINPEAVETTKLNAKASKTHVNAFQSDLFSSVEGRFDLIVFNPPYLPAEERDVTYSGGKSGRDTIEKFIVQAKKYLNPGGGVMIVISSLTGEKEVIELFKEQGMKATVIDKEKVPWEELIVLGANLEHGQALQGVRQK